MLQTYCSTLSRFSGLFKQPPVPTCFHKSSKAKRKTQSPVHLCPSSPSSSSSKRLLPQLLPSPMDDYNRFHIPAFGSWDCYDGLPFTQCFDEASSARQPGMLRYTYSVDRDLYVAGDLYQDDVVTPAMIVVPRRRRRRAKVSDPIHDAKGGKAKSWASDFKEPTSPPFVTTRPTPKPVDEDLYKIPPELLYAEPKKKRGWSFWSCCLVPTRVS